MKINLGGVLERATAKRLIYHDDDQEWSFACIILGSIWILTYLVYQIIPDLRLIAGT